MNREIEFRGKRVDNGQWITGGYVEWSDARCNKFHQIVSSVGYHNDIVSKTVGQFTGLHDKNGKEIYEGDIFIKKVDNFRGGEDVINLVVIYNIHTVGFAGKSKEAILYSLDNMCEIIGNIHDKPELLTDK